MVDIAPCRKCGSEIRVRASRCPECGFDPRAEHASKMRTWGVVTALLFLSIVGIPLAILTGKAAWNHRREVKKGVTE